LSLRPSHPRARREQAEWTRPAAPRTHRSSPSAAIPRRLKSCSRHTLCTTALVHEAYVKLADQTRAQFASRAHFLAVAAQAMRRILVGYARKVRTEKRGGNWRRLDLDQVDIPVEERAEALVGLEVSSAAFCGFSAFCVMLLDEP
jgi:hypothetical protein